MKRVLLILITVFTCLSVHSQNKDNSTDTKKLDSIYKIIQHEHIPINKKLEIIANNDIKKFGVKGAIKIWEVVVEDCKREKDINNLTYCYCKIANMTLGKYDEESIKSAGIYLDSAQIYANEINDTEALAIYNYTQGLYKVLYVPEKGKEAYDHFYKALFYYEKLGNSPRIIVSILTALGGEASLREDTVSLKRIRAKAESLKTDEKMKDNASLNFIINEFTSAIYKMRFKATKEEYCIDSIVYYEKKSITEYENNPQGLEPMIANINLSYTSIIEYETKREKPDFKLLDWSIKKGEEMAKLIHYTPIDVRIEFSKALITYRMNKLDEAEKHALHANELLANYREFGYQQFYADNYEILEIICEAKGDYNGVIENGNKKTACFLEIRNNETKMLELQYNSGRKEDEIKNLEGQNKYQSIRTKLTITICILLAIVTLLMHLVFFNKRKSMDQSAALEKKSKEDAELQVKLKEEQAEKMQLEKYEVLSDFHLKEMELIGKNKELEQLEADKKALDEQVEQFANKISEYEKTILSQDNNGGNYPICDVINEDLKQLIEKRLKNTKDYIAKLNSEINENYISFIKEKYDGRITVQYIKYCICIAIGMEVSEIADCFSIEHASVHALRYRLKKKFGLGIDDNLELFLMPNKSSITNTSL